MLSALDRYLARMIAVPLMGTLLIAILLLVVDQMQRLFRFVTVQGGPIGLVWRMLVDLLPEYLGLGLPIALTLGMLLAFRRLAITSELDVMRAIGMGYGRLLRVPYLYAVGLCIVNLAVVGFMQPYARFSYEGLRFKLSSGALGASIKVGDFNPLGKHMMLRVEKSRNNGHDLSGIFVQRDQRDGSSLTTTAQSGQFLSTDDPTVIIFRLTNGKLIHDAPAFTSPRALSFAAYDLPIDMPKFAAFRGRGSHTLEKTLPELIRAGFDGQAPSEVRVESQANLYLRLSQVVVMLFLPMLSVSLGVPPKRSSSALGIFLSILLLVVFFKSNEYAQSFSTAGNIDPLIVMAVPLAIFAALTLWMYRVLAHRAGGQPIGALEQLSVTLGARLRALSLVSGSK